ncbi:unnamed protein product [Schistosoma margrebowiei]|uniref:Uncharacterized protein n=1 Tax=Schistosoma margrebowiei TaxID=48269 RepID=A0A183MIN3_9TREM|nr:unnamed protein product [Schistosoma margrebowiei]
MDITNNSDKHSLIPSSSSSSTTTTATPSSSSTTTVTPSSSSYTSNQHKIKRLKILQEIEDRKFQLNYNRLMKEQNKICKQLDIQRLQFTRRFSETNFNLSFDELPCKLLKNDNIILDFKKFKQQQQPSPQQQQPPPPQQQQHSITNNDHVHSYYDFNSQDNIHDNDYLNQPFWLRLRSLGVPSDEDTLLAALTCKNMNIDNKLETNYNEDDVFESNCKSSIINDQLLTRRISRNIEKQRSSSVTGADELLKNVLTNNNNIKLIKRSLSLEEKKPNWLVTLNQMKRDKLTRINSNKQEEITALFKGNKFYGHNKRSNVLTIKYQPRNDRLIKSHRHTIVGITHEFTPL